MSDKPRLAEALKMLPEVLPVDSPPQPARAVLKTIYVRLKACGTEADAAELAERYEAVFLRGYPGSLPVRKNRPGYWFTPTDQREGSRPCASVIRPT